MRQLSEFEYSEIQKMDAEDWSTFLAYGDPMQPLLSKEEEDAWLRWSRSQRSFDL